MVSVFPFRTMSSARRISCKVRLTWTLERPVASARSAWVSGKAQLRPLRQAGKAQAEEDLAQQMRHPLGCGALTEIEGPFTLDRCVHQRFPPQRGGNARISGADFVEEIPRQIGDRHRGDRADRVVHLLQDEHVEVAHVPGQEERHHLTAAILELLVAASPTRQDQVHVFRLVAFARDIDARRKFAQAIRSRAGENREVCRRQPDELLELSGSADSWPVFSTGESIATWEAGNNLCYFGLRTRCVNRAFLKKMGRPSPAQPPFPSLGGRSSAVREISSPPSILTTTS